jgi:hypothetical protein
MFLGAPSVEPFYFISFGRKRLQMAPEAAGEALPNGESLSSLYIYSLSISISRNQFIIF